MKKSLPIALLAITFACSMHAAPARAQAARTFVSAAGSDSNNCLNVLTPCRHFAAAFAVTGTNGEIYVLDPANYGSLTITHAVSIQGHSWGSVAPPSSGGAGITINAPSGDIVNLDGLTIDGTGLTNTIGIAFNSGGSLTVANCVVRNMAGIGFGLVFLSNAVAPQKLAVSNSYFADISFDGIVIEANSSGSVTASIDRTAFYGNGVGLSAFGATGTGPLSVAVTDSEATNSTNTGFFATSSAGHSVTNLSLTHVLASGNFTGVEANGTNATIWLAQSTVTENTHGFDVEPGAVINSYGDNYLAAANGSNTGSLTSVSKQ
jgi:hypothetical protein